MGRESIISLTVNSNNLDFRRLRLSVSHCFGCSGSLAEHMLSPGAGETVLQGPGRQGSLHCTQPSQAPRPTVKEAARSLPVPSPGASALACLLNQVWGLSPGQQLSSGAQISLRSELRGHRPSSHRPSSAQCLCSRGKRPLQSWGRVGGPGNYHYLRRPAGVRPSQGAHVKEVVRTVLGGQVQYKMCDI